MALKTTTQQPLMPKATAVWLVENTALTFEQIADFVGLHMLEVQAIADGEVDIGMRGLDPVSTGQVSLAEIERCAADPDARLAMLKSDIPLSSAKQKGARYTPVSKRQDRPDAISWLLKNYPELSDAQISRLIGTTKPTINAIRDKTHWNATNIKPRNPVGLGLCSESDLQKYVAIARARAGITHVPAPVEETPQPEDIAAQELAAAAAEAENKRHSVESLFGTQPTSTSPAPAETGEDVDPRDGATPDLNVVFGPKKADS
jgi:hypothetical protein